MNATRSVRAALNNTAWTLCVVLFATTNVAAQTASAGRLEGTVTLRGQQRVISTASIHATRLDPEPVVSFSATPDERGRFWLDSLPAGRYMIQLASPALDSLFLSLPSSELRVVPGVTSRADLYMPVGQAIRDAVCPGVTLGEGRGVVAGRVVDADTEEPISAADVVVAWNEISMNRRTLKATNVERSGVVHTGTHGEYRLCGVPTGRWLSIQLQHQLRAGGIARLSVSDDEGAVVRNLSLSLQSAPLIATLDSLDRTAPRQDEEDTIGYVKGTAAISGTVLGTGGRPLASAEVRIAHTPAATMTDAAGRFLLSELPAGTQQLSVRRIGYAVADAGVELRAGKTLVRDIPLQRLVALDSIHIIAQKTQFPEFEYNRRTNMYGIFYTADDIARRDPVEVSELLLRLGGFTVVGSGVGAKVVSNVAKSRRAGCTEVNVVIDGVEYAGANYLAPSQIAGIEAYRDQAAAPPSYHAECGLVVIWTKRYRAKPKSLVPSDSVQVR